MRFFAVSLLLFYGLNAYADRNKKALKALEKGNFQAVELQLIKSVEKDPVNPGASYIYSLLFTTNSFNRYNLDSAYYFVLKAKIELDKVDQKVLKVLEKNVIGVEDFNTQQMLIEQLAFERAVDLNTISDYEYFMKYFSASGQIPAAIQKRNVLIYDKVVKNNTWQAYKNFMEQFPTAEQVSLAEKAYQRLLYLDQTGDGKLQSLENFLKQHPDNEHRRAAERKILNIRAGLNRLADYVNFMKDYPGSYWNKEAVNRSFHLDKDFFSFNGFASYTKNQITRDSLNEVIQLNSKSILPVYESGKYGFIDICGEVILQPQYGYIKEEYLCGNIQSDILEVSSDGSLKLVNYSGAPIYQGGFDETTDLGGGFVKMRKNGRYGVWHKSGFDILPSNFEDIQLLNSNLFKVRVNGKWALYSVFGEEFLNPQFDDIYLIKDFWIFEKDDLLAVVNLDYLEPLTDGNTISLDFKFDEVELVKDKYLLCYSNDFESLLNEDLGVVINSSDQTIIPMRDNWMVKRDSGYFYYHEEKEFFLEESFRDISFSKNWFAFKRDSTWTLLSEGFGFEPRFDLDSVSVLNDKMVYFQKDDTSRIAFYPNRLVVIQRGDQMNLTGTISANDSSQYLLIKNDDVERVYSEKGEFHFNSKYDNVDYLSSGYFSYEWRGKKGILNSNGGIVLKAGYDGIGQVLDSIAPILSKGRFGYFDLSKKFLLEPTYLKRIEQYNQIYQVALTEEGYGFLSSGGEVISEFEFAEIGYWNDSVALVKEDNWSLYNIEDEEIVLEGIQRVDYILNGNIEKVAYFLTDKGFGIFSNVKGVILSPSFNNIVNLGTAEKPIFFAEKHIPEADFYVVVYANAQGKTIRSQAFRSQEYEMILCEE